MSIPYEYTDKSITPWGGLRLVEEFYRKSGLRDKIRDLDWHTPGSNRGFDPAEIMEGFIFSTILGAKRFAHSGTLRHDEVVREIFGWKKGMASQSTFSRFFQKYGHLKSDELFLNLNKWWFSQIQNDKYTLDLDSTVLTRYGSQGGVEVGYNPRKPGRGSHHPLMAFIPEIRMVVNAWMRPGKASASSELELFFDQVLEILPKEKIGLVRADSGFFGDNVMNYFEGHDIKYIIASRLTGGVQDKIRNRKGWVVLKEGIEYFVTNYKATGWKEARRMVVLRKNAEQLPKSGGKYLFPEYDNYEKYRYSAFFTNSELSGDLIWTVYKHRAEAENQIRELKYDYGIEGFACKELHATEMAFRWVMIAYNLMSLFKLMVLQSKQIPQLSTLKFQCIAIGGYLVKHARKTKLILSAKEKRRRFLDRLFKNLEHYTAEMKIPNA